jgi:hypothetical protein
MKTKKYAIFEPNLIFNGIKYQVGKRYKKDKFLFSDKDIRILFLNYLIKADLIKQIEIRIIYEYDDYYIIHNEINYYEDFNSNFELEFKNLFLLLRYRDKNIINKNIDSMSIYEKIALAIVGNRSHIKKLIQWAKNQTIKYFDLDILNYHILKNINKNDYLELQPINDNLKEAFKRIGFKEINKILEENYFLYNETIANLGYDKYLDCFINNKKCLYSEILFSAILDKGRHKDLDLFINDCKELFIAEPIIYWQREKDLIKLSKSKNKEISWLANKELNEIEFI